ncbi:MAG: CinA family protein [Candidatus Omnitrophica bacterium]|nr:CinA family protein [Candidatus Omnitrophota bacterium]
MIGTSGQEKKGVIQLADKLSAAKMTLSLAESCTGGLVSSLITNIPGSSSFFYGALIAYSNMIKTGMLDVPSEIIASKGAVSAQTAEAMAVNTRLKFATDISGAITGIAGPGGGSADKPVGTAYMAVATAKGVFSKRIMSSGTREEVKCSFAQELIWFLSESIR